VSLVRYEEGENRKRARKMNTKKRGSSLMLSDYDQVKCS
jgi:hypothetical protein